MQLADAGVLAALIAVGALLYSSVGHGGASAYLAAMALYGLAPETMKPTALVLNLVVASVGSITHFRAGNVKWRILGPLIGASIPAAFIGGATKIGADAYLPLLGGTLLVAAARLAWPFKDAEPTRTPPVWALVAAGASIGFLSGLVGVGGGIFLSPLLLLFRWSDAKTTAGASVVFILANSAAGLAGHLASLEKVPGELVLWAPCALVGGLAGAWLGAHKVPPVAFRRILALVLLVAAVKMLGS